MAVRTYAMRCKQSAYTYMQKFTGYLHILCYT